MPVAIVVGGTPKLSTMPPSATGRDDTLNDMVAWPSAMAIMGIQDAFRRLHVVDGRCACHRYPRD